MNIFTLLTKYAAGRQQVENQYTLSLVALLQYYPAFLIHFVNSFSEYHRVKVIEFNQLSVIPHPIIKLKNKNSLYPDLIINYQNKPLIVFEMKINSQIKDHQYLYGQYSKCPLILVTKHFLSASEKHYLTNITWNDIGRICDDFLMSCMRSNKNEFMSEFIDFLKETKMYFPSDVLTKTNFQYLAKMLCSKIVNKNMTRGLQESIDLLNWLTNFLNHHYERLCVNYPWMCEIDSSTRLVDNFYWEGDEEKYKTVNLSLDKSPFNDRNILLYRYIGKWNSKADAGISFGWIHDNVNDEWYFFTSHYIGSKDQADLKKYVPKFDSEFHKWARDYREKDHYIEKFIPSKKQLANFIPIWEMEIDKIGKWYSNSKLSNKVKRIRRTAAKN